MKRTTISLPDDLALALDREVRRRHTSASEVAREALAQHLGMTAEGSRKLSFAALGRSGQHTTARDMEELLKQEWHDSPGDR
jgi:Arc/MetJ-type ribon-helix-helix transcriptional regulator